MSSRASAFTGGNMDAALQAFEEVSVLMRATDDLDRHIKGDLAQGMFLVARDAEEAGGSVKGAIQQLRDNPPEGDLSTYLTRTKLPDGSKVEAKNITKGGETLLETIQDSPQFGLDNDFFWTNNAQWENLPIPVQKHMREVMSRAAAVLQIPDPNNEEVQALASQMMINDLSSDVALVNGELMNVPALNKVPKEVFNPGTGKVEAGRPFTPQDLETFKTSLGTDLVRAMSPMGEIVGLRQDERTRFGDGMAVIGTPNGFPETISLTPGDPLVDENGRGIDVEFYEANKEFFDMIFDVIIGNDDVVMIGPEAPINGGDRIALGQGYFWSFDPRSGNWGLRFGTAGPLVEGVEDLPARPLRAGRQGISKSAEGAIGSPAVNERDIILGNIAKRKAFADEREAAGTATFFGLSTDPERVGELADLSDNPEEVLVQRDPRNLGGRDSKKLKQHKQNGPEFHRGNNASLLARASARLSITPNAHRRGLQNIDAQPEDLLNQAAEDSREEAGFVTDASTGLPKQFMPRLLTDIRKAEGSRRVAYNDFTGKTIGTPGASSQKGTPHIGVGFNLARADAREKIEALGADFDQIIAGKASLDSTQIDELLNITIKEEMDFIRKRLGVDTFKKLKGYQLRALVSLSFNARSLIGKKLVDAAKAEDWDEVTNQIRNFSNGGNQPANIKVSLQSRREIEANLFEGSLKQ